MQKGEHKNWDDLILGNILQKRVKYVLARTWENIKLGLPLEAGADPEETCRILGIEIDYDGVRFKDRLSCPSVVG